MIQETFYTIVLIFYGWILFLEFVTFILSDSYLVIVMFLVMSLFESGIYYLRLSATVGKKIQFYTGMILNLCYMDFVFHFSMWFFLPLEQRLIIPLLLVIDSGRIYYEFMPQEVKLTQENEFSVSIDTCDARVFDGD